MYGLFGTNNNTRNAGQGNAYDFEILQNARRDLIGEIGAVIEYDDHIHNTTNSVAKTTWENIRNEELTHVGELLALINYLAPYQKQFVEQGINEFNERLNQS